MSEKIKTNLNFLILLITIIVFSLVSISIVITSENNAAENDTAEDDTPNFGPALNFSVLTTEGNNYTLSNDIGKKMIIIDFMATWCNPCLEIGKVYTQTLAENPDTLTIVSISIEPKDTATFLDAWRLAWDFEWAFIPYGEHTEELVDGYSVDVGIPASFFIDLEGIIRVSHLGTLTQKTVNNWLNGNYS